MTSATEQHQQSEEQQEYEAWLADDRETSRRIWKISAILFVVALAVFLVLMALLAGSGAESESVVSLFS